MPPDCPRCHDLEDRVARLETQLEAVRVIGRLAMKGSAAIQSHDVVEFERINGELQLILREHTDGL